MWYSGLVVNNVSSSLRFYCATLEFKIEYERPEESFTFLSFEGAQLMLLQENGNQHSRTGPLDYPRGQGVNFSIVTSDLQRIAQSRERIGHPLRIATGVSGGVKSVVAA